MRQLLPLVRNPSHYLGCEPNSVHKSPETVDLRWGLAFPDVYDLGMSYLGQKVLYQVLNEQPRVWAERVFAPHLQMAELLRQRLVPLSTLESDTPVNRLDVLGFSLTHELCYTTVLFMLDLAGIPFRAADRGPAYPLIIAGGGAVMNPAPLLPFFDCFVVGEGEDVILEISRALLNEAGDKPDRGEALRRLRDIPGVLLPPDSAESTADDSCCQWPVERRIVSDLDAAPSADKPILPFGKPVHDRFTAEIARGCTRGCRFCQAGMTYRPVRERSLERLEGILEQGLALSGYEDLSFLALSAGDFSALDGLFRQSFHLCSRNQVAISLPSLRVGSLSPLIMNMLTSLRRTGATLAPEAGSERLRRVINKGIDEQDLLTHAEQLFSLGWNRIKLYFMIGLPTETEADLRAILELCRKVQELGRRRGKRLRVTASVTPFIPKPHTPFQWEAQLSLSEARQTIDFLRSLFKPEKHLELRYHSPEMSFVEGVFSRGGQELAEVLEAAYRLGDTFTSWEECFDLATWQRAMSNCGIDPEPLLGYRGHTDPLPWDCIQTGLSKAFLWRERERAMSERPTPDCRYQACRQCGVCTDRQDSSMLQRQAAEHPIKHSLNRRQRDQENEAAAPTIPHRSGDLTVKGLYLHLWYVKEGPAAYLSQLELQSLFERMLRRAGLPLTFSAGFHPQPLFSFGRALPVGVASRSECVSVCLRHWPEANNVLEALNSWSIPGLRFVRCQTAGSKKLPEAIRERFLLRFHTSECRSLELRKAWSKAMQSQRIVLTKRSKKGRLQEIDCRTRLESVSTSPSQGLYLVFNWQEGYINPVTLVQRIMFGIEPQDYELIKLEQLAGTSS